MTRKIQISIADTDLAVTADLLDDINRDTCDIFWNNTPFECTLFHTLVSGKNIHSFIPEIMPFFAHDPTLVRRMASDPGTVFSPDSRRLFIKYGADSEDRSFAPIARVRPDDLPKLDAIGRLAWDSIHSTKQWYRIQVSRVGDARAAEPFGARLFDPASFESPQVGALVADINGEIERIWLEPPAELLALHSGEHSAKTGLGSYGRYFSTILFAEKETSRISNIANSGAIDNLLRLCHQTAVDLDVLKRATRIFCDGLIEFLGMCAQDRFTGLYRRAVESFDALSSKDEYFRLFATYSLYATRFNSWHLHMFPWHLGDSYTYGETRGR